MKEVAGWSVAEQPSLILQNIVGTIFSTRYPFSIPAMACYTHYSRSVPVLKDKYETNTRNIVPGSFNCSDETKTNTSRRPGPADRHDQRTAHDNARYTLPSVPCRVAFANTLARALVHGPLPGNLRRLAQCGLHLTTKPEGG